MEVYAAMIDRMDQGIGRVMRALEETGMSENTLILFLSDNGACGCSVVERGLRTSGQNPQRAGELPAFSKSRSPDQRFCPVVLNDPLVPVGARGSYLFYREPWAYVSNTPFRLHKDWAHEGGIATPLIAHWPKGIRDSGRITDEVGHVMDIMPTALELAGAGFPEAQGGRSLLEGRSFAPVFASQAPEEREALYWAYGGNWAVRQGDWKLVYDSNRSKRMELYNLAEDPTELNDLSAERPDRLQALRALWEAWAERVGARERLTITKASNHGK
jgi:arylsulfatase